MKYHQYKGVVEREYKMSLKKIMHQLCVTENLSAAEGAKKLGIAKEVFVFWRHYFRLEKRQILFDQKVQELTDLETLDSSDAERKKTARGKGSLDPKSVSSLEDVICSVIEYYKFMYYSGEGMEGKRAELPLDRLCKSLSDDFRQRDINEALKAK